MKTALICSSHIWLRARRPSIALPSICLLGMSILSGCEQAAEETAEEIVRPARLLEIIDPSLSLNRVFPGVVAAGDDAALAFRVSGRLADLPAKDKIGQFVEQGELLAALDPQDFEIAVNDAKASADLARANFNRAEQLVDAGHVSRLEYDQMRAAVGSAQARLDKAQADLSYTRLVAPFKARVAQVPVSNFESIQAKDPIVLLEATDSLDVEIQVPSSVVAVVPEEAKARFRTGQRREQSVLGIEFEGQAKRYEAWVKEWETTPNPATLAYRVVVTTPAPDGIEILPGADARVHLDLGALEAGSPEIVIPPEAVFAAEDQPLNSVDRFVWVVDPDAMTVHRRAIRIGDLSTAGLSVESGLSTGDTIVTAGVDFLTEGTRVRALSREAGL